MTLETNKLNKILEDNGKEGVELYRQSLIDNDRVATGDTKNSIRFTTEVKQVNSTLTFYALDHIRDLETGQTPEQIQSDPPQLTDLVRWANARGINRTARGILRGLLLNGFEGTSGLITSVDEQIKNNVTNDVQKGLKSIILDEIRTSKNGNNSNQ